MAALSTLDLNLEVVDTTIALHADQDGSIARPAVPPDIVIVHHNPDTLPNLLRLCGPELFDGVYTIGIWVWELMAFRPEWIEAFGAIDEVWTPSLFATEAVSTMAPEGVVIRTIPHVVEPADYSSTIQRKDLGIRDDAFVFLCIFDASSAFARKNPIGVLAAFTEAFGSSGAAVLVMKFHSAEKEEAHIEAMQSNYAASNILFLDRLMEPAEVAAIRRTADCYVSAHRSEGFGLNIAEAMAMGQPVLATAYSGNLSFCSNTNCVLIPAHLAEVPKGVPHYPAGSVWAEPQHDDLVAAMRTVFEDSSFAKGIGERAANDIRQNLNRQTIAEKIGQAVHAVAARRSEAARSLQRRRRLAWRHPGARGAKQFMSGSWPRISVILPAANFTVAEISRQVRSLIAQEYPHWELCICEDASADAPMIEYLSGLRASDQRIRARRLSKRALHSEIILAAVEMSTGELLIIAEREFALVPRDMASLAIDFVTNRERASSEVRQVNVHMGRADMNVILKSRFLETAGAELSV